MKIAMYGGSFDPPHLGHLNVVLNALNTYDDVEEIVVTPCYKQTGKELSDFAHRYNMCKLMFGNLPRVSVSCVEHDLGGESLTLRTVRFMKMLSPEGYRPEIVLIVGSDTADKMPYWEGGKELMNEVEIRIAPRTNISSTEIRKYLKHSNPCDKTTRDVSLYAFENLLYAHRTC
jgi:nicotinate (nicotinamide) nucleotide adenylyltransferase